MPERDGFTPGPWQVCPVSNFEDEWAAPTHCIVHDPAAHQMFLQKTGQV